MLKIYLYPEPGQPARGERVATQYRTDVADWSNGSGHKTGRHWRDNGISWEMGVDRAFRYLAISFSSVCVLADQSDGATPSQRLNARLKFAMSE